jgi:hypothetical protein
MNKSADDSRQRFRKLALVEIDPKGFLTPDEPLHDIHGLLRVVDVVDDIFWHQISSEAGPTSLLALAGQDQELKEMFLSYYGPYDPLDNDSPFLPVEPRPPGAGFYPRELTREGFTDYVDNHPDRKSSFESPYTIIRRIDPSHLAAVPYHEAFHEQVALLSDLLADASRNENHPRFREFLAQRSSDVLTDNYYASDSLWVRLFDNPWDLVVGPYEVYQDQLIGLKAAYEALLLRRDFAESSKLTHFQHELPSLCRSLSSEIGKRLRVEDSRVALSVSNLIYAGGEARKATPAFAFSLPNDERTIEDVGSRQVIIRNVQEAKFRLVDWQIHKRLLQQPLGEEELALRCFFDHTLFHEISHSIGPHRIKRNGELSTVNRSLRQHHSVLEETKADTLAACLILHTCNDSNARAFLGTYVSGFLRAIRLGLSTAHGGANAVQFNFLLKEGAIAIHPKSGSVVIDQEKSRKSLIQLISNVIGIQESGDFEGAARFLNAFCVMNPEIERLVGRLSDLPIDIRIRYKTDHEHSAMERLVTEASVGLNY